MSAQTFTDPRCICERPTTVGWRSHLRTGQYRVVADCFVHGWLPKKSSGSVPADPERNPIGRQEAK